MTMPFLGFIAVVLLATGLAAPFFAAAFAEPLDQTACLGLQAERKKLLTPKMQTALEQGPDWVKDHLNDEDIEKVREFLLVEEKIEFRCRGANVVAKALQNAATNPDRVTLPDRKPPVPQNAVASGDPEMPLPDRKPGAAQSAEANVPASQTVADSAKTAPSKTKATR
jgi:hypothetical protein